MVTIKRLHAGAAPLSVSKVIRTTVDNHLPPTSNVVLQSNTVKCTDSASAAAPPGGLEP